MMKKTGKTAADHANYSSDNKCDYSVVSGNNLRPAPNGGYKSQALKSYSESPYRGKNPDAYFDRVVGHGRD